MHSQIVQNIATINPFLSTLSQNVERITASTRDANDRTQGQKSNKTGILDPYCLKSSIKSLVPIIILRIPTRYVR